jgi:hypothetical protein
MGHRKDLLRHRFGSRSIVQGGGASSAEMGHMKNRYAIVSGDGSMSREMAHCPRRLAIVPRFCQIVSGDTPLSREMARDPRRQASRRTFWLIVSGDALLSGEMWHHLRRYASIRIFCGIVPVRSPRTSRAAHRAAGGELRLLGGEGSRFLQERASLRDQLARGRMASASAPLKKGFVVPGGSLESRGPSEGRERRLTIRMAPFRPGPARTLSERSIVGHQSSSSE